MKRLALLLFVLAVSGIASADTATLYSNGDCGSYGSGTTQTATASSGTAVLGSPCFQYTADFNVYITDGSGNVRDHIFSNEGLGQHDAVYFVGNPSLDSSIGGACPVLAECVMETGSLQDLTAYDSYSYGYVTGLFFQSDESPTPEPSSIMLLATGVVGLSGTIRRKLTR